MSQGDPGAGHLGGSHPLDMVVAELNGPFAGLMGPGKELQQGALPGAVGTDHTQQCTGLDIEADVLDGRDASEALRDAVDRQAGGAGTGAVR